MSYKIYAYTCPNGGPQCCLITFDNYFGKNKKEDDPKKYVFSQNVKLYTKALYCTMDEDSNDIIYELVVKSVRKKPLDIKLAENRSEFKKFVLPHKKGGGAFYITKKINDEYVDMKMDKRGVAIIDP